MVGYIAAVTVPVTPRIDHVKIVTPPLNRVRSMVDDVRTAAASQTLTNLGLVVSIMIGLTGLIAFFNSGITAQMQQVNEHMASTDRNVARLADVIASGLRPDEVNRHLSSQDGRMDAYDSRLRQDEENLTRVRTLLEQIKIGTPTGGDSH